MSKILVSKGWTFLILCLLVVVAYANSFPNKFLSDDFFAISQNPTIGQFSYLFENPIFFARAIPYYILFKLAGPAPFLFRFFNILLHLGVVLSLHTILTRLYNDKTAFFAAALVAVHPLLTEGVTWVSGGIYPQYTLFLLLSFWFYLKSSENLPSIYISIFCYILALSTSEKAIIFPILLILFEWTQGTVKRNISKTYVFLGLTGVLGLLYITRIQARLFALKNTYYQTGGVDNPLVQIPTAITEYLALIFFPKDLSFYHSELSLGGLEYIIRLVFFLCFIGIIILAYKKNKHIFFWLSAFFVSLLPTLTPFRLSWLVAERYVYFGTVCVLVACAIGLSKLSEKKEWRLPVYVLISLILTLFTIRTIVRNNDWKDQDHLWLATARVSPSSPQNHNNLGDLYARRGDFKKAVEEFKLAILLHPNYADAYHNLGNTYQDLKEYDQALDSYEKALSINPSLWQSHQNRGAVYFMLKDFKNAEDEFGKAIIIYPKNPDLHAILGIVYLFQNKKTEAEEEFLIALQIDPSNQKAQAGLAEIRKNL